MVRRLFEAQRLLEETFLMYCTTEKNHRFFSFLKIMIFFINTSLMYYTAETSHSYSFFQKDHPISRNTGNKTPSLLIIYVSLYRLWQAHEMELEF